MYNWLFDSGEYLILFQLYVHVINFPLFEMDLGLHLKKFKSLTQECFVPSLKLIKLFWRRSHKCKMSTDEWTENGCWTK